MTFRGVDPTQPNPQPRYGLASSTAGMVFLHSIDLFDLVRAQFLAPGTTVRLAREPHVTGIVTDRGRLQLESGATFADPEEAAKSVSMQEPWPDWSDWQLDADRSLATIAGAARRTSVRAAPSDPIDRLGLSVRTTRTLRSAGFTRVTDLIGRYEGLGNVRGIGERSILEIASSLAASELDPAARDS